MSNVMLDVGQANELKMAFRRADFSNEDIKRLCEGNVLADVRRVLLGYATTMNVIDCDADPFLPEGWKVEEHKKGGKIAFDPSCFDLYLDGDQRGFGHIEGNKLRQRLADRPVLNANVLDYLIANQDLIPEEWKIDEYGNIRHIFFWGTVYRQSNGDLCVRYLAGTAGRWRWGNYTLVSEWQHWEGHCPALLRAMNSVP